MDICDSKFAFATEKSEKWICLNDFPGINLMRWVISWFWQDLFHWHPLCHCTWSSIIARIMMVYDQENDYDKLPAKFQYPHLWWAWDWACQTSPSSRLDSWDPAQLYEPWTLSCCIGWWSQRTGQFQTIGFDVWWNFQTSWSNIDSAFSYHPEDNKQMKLMFQINTVL